MAHRVGILDLDRNVFGESLQCDDVYDADFVSLIQKHILEHSEPCRPKAPMGASMRSICIDGRCHHCKSANSKIPNIHRGSGR